MGRVRVMGRVRARARARFRGRVTRGVEKSSLRDGQGSHSRFLGLAWRVTCRPWGVVSGSRGAGVPGLRACVGSGLGLGLGFRVRGVGQGCGSGLEAGQGYDQVYGRVGGQGKRVEARLRARARVRVRVRVNPNPKRLG